MGKLQRVKIGKGVGITTPNGQIRLFVKEVGGTGTTRTGKAEVHGSPLIPDGTLVEFTQHDGVRLMRDLSVIISEIPASGTKLCLYFQKQRNAYNYRIYPLKNYELEAGIHSQTLPRIV